MKKISRRSFLTAAALCGATAALTACGGSSSSTAASSTASAAASEGASSAAAAANYKIGIMTASLDTVEEYYRTAEMLIDEFGSDKFIVDVFPSNSQNEQEVTISKSLNIAMDPDVKVMVFDMADIGTLASVDKIREERPDMKFYFGSLNEDVYEQQKVADLMLTTNPEMYGEAVANMAVNAGAKHFVFYSFARHMSNSMKIRYMNSMKAVCDEHGVEFDQVSMPDPMGDSGVSGAQQFLLESIPSLIDQYGTKDVAFFATVSTIQETLLKTVVENGAIYPCHTDPSPFSAFAGALGLEVDDEHKYDAEYMVNLISDKLAEYGENGRVGGWERSYIRCEMEFLLRYAIAYCEGQTNEVDGVPDPDVVADIMDTVYGDTVQYLNCTNDTTGEEYKNWLTVGRELYVF